MCYTVTLAGALVTSAIWQRTKNVKLWWLNLMFWGGSLFGVIDHLWNGELFLIGKDLIKDLLLGLTIALGIVFTWIALILFAKANSTLSGYINFQRQ